MPSLLVATAVTGTDTPMPAVICSLEKMLVGIINGWVNWIAFVPGSYKGMYISVPSVFRCTRPASPLLNKRAIFKIFSAGLAMPKNDRSPPEMV